MAFDKKQFQDLIQRTLQDLGMQSESAVNLLLGTAAQESQFGTYIRQIGGGPALGVFQMEPDTEIDIWDNYLRYRSELACIVTIISGQAAPSPIDLEANLSYQIAMARIYYRRIPEAFPRADDVAGLARYWKQYYNTRLGSGTKEEFVRNYAKYVLDGRFD